MKTHHNTDPNSYGVKPHMPDVSKQPKSEYQRVKELMKELQSPSGFDPLPPDQHKWHMDPGLPELQRLWGWMIGHTVHWGHRSAYAINKGDGHELHIEHAAKELGLDLPNAYRAWRKGIERGIFRAGQPSEGTRRLYLTGKVPRFKGRTEGDEKTVQTIFPAHILKQINEWEPERREELRRILEEEEELEIATQAALVAANRAVFIRRQDSILDERGVKPARQQHRKQCEDEAAEEARRARLVPITAPIEEYVQTIRDYVQTAPKTPLQTNASLLHSESKYQRSIPRSVEPSGNPRSRRTQEGERSQPVKQGYALQPVQPLTDGEKQAGELIYSEIRRLQNHERYMHMQFTREKISETRKSDQLFVLRVIAAVGPNNVVQFLQTVDEQLQRLDRNALGKLPGRAPAPRSLGLILQWAIEYGERLDEAAKMEAAEAKRLLDWKIRIYQEMLQDPAETADAKYEARKFLEAHALKDAQTA